MVNVKDVDTEKLIMYLASSLEKMEEFKPPAWAPLVKTGTHKERPPVQANWWWIRTASILRHVSLNQELGVSKLRKRYGGRKNLGHKPEHKRKASGAIIRNVLKQLEAAGFVEKKEKKGRKITKKGQTFLHQAAKAVK